MMPFISTVFVIAGLCSLGLPGFSGFVAEMTVFMGSWEKSRCILSHRHHYCMCFNRSYGSVYFESNRQAIMGPIVNEEHLSLGDATWNEKLAAGLLILGIIVIGIVPFLLKDLINPGTEVIIQKMGAAIVR